MSVEWTPEREVVLTAEELAQAIVDIRVINFPSLIGDRGGPTQKTKGIDTTVRDRDLDYAKAVITRITRNRKNG